MDVLFRINSGRDGLKKAGTMCVSALFRSVSAVAKTGGCCIIMYSKQVVDTCTNNQIFSVSIAFHLMENNQSFKVTGHVW